MDRAEQELECLGSPPDPTQTHFAATSKVFDSGPQKALGNWGSEGHSPDTASRGVLDLRKGADMLASDQGGGC